MNFVRITAIWAAFVAYNNFLFWITLRPFTGVPSFISRLDKVIHALLFALLYALTLPAFRMLRRFVTSPETASFGYALLIGVLIEWLQRGVPTRQASLADIAADAVGIAGAFAAFYAAGRTAR